MTDRRGPPDLRRATTLAAAIRAAEVGAGEVLEEHLARLERSNEQLNFLAFIDEDSARSAARAVDDAVADSRLDELGPFAGVPMLVKDLNDVRGWPTSHGSRSCDTSAKTADSLPVGRLRSAGFVFTGKTTTPEFGSIPVTESLRFGATRNPWDTEHSPGGSSGGAAAAVAAGVLPAAHASDGGGSIRIPSSSCGLVGLKPSRHRVTNDIATMAAASTQGVVSRTVADQAGILDVMAAPDPGAWEVAPPFARPLAEEVGVDPGALRIRVALDNLLGLPVDPECRAAVESTASTLEALGHHVEFADAHWPDAAQLFSGFLTVWSTITAPAPIVDEDLLEPHNRANRAQALETSSIAYSRAVTDLQRASREFTPQFGRDFDLLLTPTMAIEPPEVGWIWTGGEDDPTAPMVAATPMAAYTAVFNVTGQPAISLPTHVSPSGLPVGVQLAAPLFDEATLVRVGSQIEEAIGWADPPPLRF